MSVGSLGISFVSRRVLSGEGVSCEEGVRLVVGFCFVWRMNGGMNDAGCGTMKECVWMGICLCACVGSGWWGVGRGGAMLMSAPFYSLTSRSNYLAYPGSSINVFQPPSPLTPQHHAVAHSRVSVRPFEGSKNPFPSTESACCHTYIIYTFTYTSVPSGRKYRGKYSHQCRKARTIFFLVVIRW